MNAGQNVPHFIIFRSDAVERRAHPVPEAVEEAVPAIDRFEQEGAAMIPEAEQAVKEAPKKAGFAWKALTGGILSGAVIDHFLHPLSFFFPSSSNRRSDNPDIDEGSQRRELGARRIEDRAVPFKTLLGGVIGGVMIDELFLKARN